MLDVPETDELDEDKLVKLTFNGAYPVKALGEKSAVILPLTTVTSPYDAQPLTGLVTMIR